MRNTDRLLYILGFFICVLAFVTKNYLEIPVAIFLVMLTTRHKFTYQAGLIALGAYFIINLMQFDIWGAIFSGFFTYIFITSWKNSFRIGNKIILNHLPAQQQQTYALLFVLFIIIDLFFGYFTFGTDVFRPIYILAVMLSALTFLSVILVCRKFFDAAYFYSAYLVLSLISYVYTLYQGFISTGEINVYIVAFMLLIVLKMLMLLIFIKENK